MEHLLHADESIVEINEDLRLIQKKTGLKFGTDSYLVSAFVKKNLRGEACDLGSGCGVISLFAAARASFKKVTAIEIQKEFADLTERNAELNGLSDKIESVCLDVRDVPSHFQKESFACVMTNPPYMKSGSGKRCASLQTDTARREINGGIDDFVKASSYLLKYGGLFYIVYRPERAAELIHSMKENSLEPKRFVTVYPDVSSAPCLILVEAKKGAAPGMKFSRPLIIYNEERKYTKDMERVYDEFSLDHLFE